MTPGSGIWRCKIGEVDPTVLPAGSDYPMRRAVEAEFVRLTGQSAEFIFSGWGAELTESERAVVEDRLPNHTLASDLDLLTERDPLVWAKAFMDFFGARRDEIDEGLMLGWFANAMTRGEWNATNRDEVA